MSITRNTFVIFVLYLGYLLVLATALITLPMTLFSPTFVLAIVGFTLAIYMIFAWNAYQQIRQKPEQVQSNTESNDAVPATRLIYVEPGRYVSADGSITLTWENADLPEINDTEGGSDHTVEVIVHR